MSTSNYRKYLSSTQWDVKHLWTTVRFEPNTKKGNTIRVVNGCPINVDCKKRTKSASSSSSDESFERSNVGAEISFSSVEGQPSTSKGLKKDTFTSDDTEMPLDGGGVPPSPIIKGINKYHFVEHDDTLAVCYDCRVVKRGLCKEHPSYLVLNNQIWRDGEEPLRDRYTLPWPLFFGEMEVTRQIEKVCTMHKLDRGFVFGPFEGHVIECRPGININDSGYLWHLRNPSNITVVIDASDRRYSNWMRFVNTSAIEDRANLEAFQFQGNIYFRIRKTIQKAEELIAWYGCRYEEDAGPYIYGIGKPRILTVASFEQIARKQRGEKKEGSKDNSVAALDLDSLSKPQSAMYHHFYLTTLEPCKGDGVELVEVQDSISSLVSPRYPLYMNKTRKVYDHSYCIPCGIGYKGLCPYHKPVLLQNKYVKRDGSIEDRAQKTTPWPLIIKESGICAPDLGVWTNRNLPQGLVIGPYEGVVQQFRIIKESSFAWKIRGRPTFEIDAKDTSVSNFLRYVNCARNVNFKNLGAMQIDDEIFYYTLKMIPRGTELMVWAGDEYGKFLGIRQEEFLNRSSTDVPEWRCPTCDSLFKEWKNFKAHTSDCYWRLSK